MAEATRKKCQCYLSLKTDLKSIVLSYFLKLFEEANFEFVTLFCRRQRRELEIRLKQLEEKKKQLEDQDKLLSERFVEQRFSTRPDNTIPTDYTTIRFNDYETADTKTGQMRRYQDELIARRAGATDQGSEYRISPRK